MINIIAVILALVVIYCFGMWIFAAVQHYRHSFTDAAEEIIERYTFHLGLCGIIAIGFLGLILVLKGS